MLCFWTPAFAGVTSFFKWCGELINIALRVVFIIAVLITSFRRRPGSMDIEQRSHGTTIVCLYFSEPGERNAEYWDKPITLR
ncbi:hypothetical protein MNBD_GAMMA25-1256 [hydrothermal vent metagenome]|uniref:Uncharacterized protein n=1 Tax=hydrothermal vent metagenome TaxID=652676 RepID=A0A3B1BYR4_9ZZZZ